MAKIETRAEVFGHPESPGRATPSRRPLRPVSGLAASLRVIFHTVAAQSPIKEALHSDDEEHQKFMSQYGGMQGAVERYKELMTLPEVKLAKGVSIDGYSTFRATLFSEAV